jgi:hypothetical protein
LYNDREDCDFAPSADCRDLLGQPGRLDLQIVLSLHVHEPSRIGSQEFAELQHDGITVTVARQAKLARSSRR